MNHKQYIGDGVYVQRDEWFNLTLTTENGISTTNTIHLEPEVYRSLQKVVSAWEQDSIDKGTQ